MSRIFQTLSPNDPDILNRLPALWIAAPVGPVQLRDPFLLKLVFDLLPNSTQYTVFLSPVRTIIFGLLIIGFLVFEPHGLAEVWRRIRRFFHLWPFRN